MGCMVGVSICGDSRPSRQDGSLTKGGHVECPGVRQACKREEVDHISVAFLRPYNGSGLVSPRGMQDFGVWCPAQVRGECVVFTLLEVCQSLQGLRCPCNNLGFLRTREFLSLGSLLSY